MTNGPEQLAELQRAIATRLKPVCQHLSASEFESLVRDIAAVTLKYGEESEASESVRGRTGTPPDESGTRDP